MPDDFSGAFLAKNHNGVLVWNYPQPTPTQRKPVPFNLYPPFHNIRESIKNDGPPRIFHACERQPKNSQERERYAWASWDRLYRDGSMLPAHYWRWKRNAHDEIGDPRYLPYLKDVLEHGMNQAEDRDIIVWTNDDIILHPGLPDYLQTHLRDYGPCDSSRTTIMRPLKAGLSYKEVGKSGGHHPGRDLFAATKAWLVEQWDLIPDYILGGSRFDMGLALLLRRHYKMPVFWNGVIPDKHPCEIPKGLISHIQHTPYWMRSDNILTAPSQRNNYKLFDEWVAKYKTQ